MNSRQAARRKAYKAGGNSNEDARKKRLENQIQVRKQKRDSSLQKRRNIAPPDQLHSKEMRHLNHISPAQLQELLTKVTNTIKGNVVEDIIKATVQVRKLLSIEEDPPIQQIVNTGIVPYFVQFLTKEQFPELQYEAAWVITNICSTDAQWTKIAVENNALDVLLQLIQRPKTSDNVREQAIWAISNIVGDLIAYRDYALEKGIVHILLPYLQDNSPLQLLRIATWAVSNVCRGLPRPKWHFVAPILNDMARLTYSVHSDITVDACWTLSYISEAEIEQIQEIINTGVIKRLVDLLISNSVQIKIPTLRTIGNILSGSDMQTQVVISCNVLPHLIALLDFPKPNVVKEACWCLSNICAGTKDQVNEVIRANAIPSVIKILDSSHYSVKKEALWIVLNICKGGTTGHVAFLVKKGVLPQLINTLNSSDTQLTNIALQAVHNILRAADSDGQVSQMADVIQNLEGVDAIERLTNHPNHKIGERAAKILDTYYYNNDDMPPDATTNSNSSNNSNSFQFSTTSNTGSLDF